MRYFSVVTASMFGTLMALFLSFFLMLLVVFVMAAGSSANSPIRSQSVLVVPLSGAIPETASGDPLAQSLLGESPYGLFEMTESIKRAAEDPRIDALWLKTGLTIIPWASLQAIRRAILEFQESGKPVYASSSAYYMSEREYFVASAADSVFLDPESLFEMNGFAATTTHYSALLEKLHIEPQIVRAGSYKSAVEPYTQTSMSEENRVQMRSLLNDISDVFINEVSSSRNLDPTEFRSRFETRATLMAKDALDDDYVDALLFDDEIRAVLLDATGLDVTEKLREVSLKSYTRTVRPRSSGSDGDVAVVYAVGTMMAGSSADVPNPLFGGSTLGSDSFIKAIRRARASNKTKAIVVRVNSPGGQASAADAMLREIRKTAESMPVVISMGDVAASGGYWIAVGAPTIVAEPLTITGSIGVFSMFFDVSGLLEDHLGITNDNVVTNPYADMLSGLRPYRPEELRLMENYTNDTYQEFIELVAEGRNILPDDVRKVAEGRVWTALAAKESGLVDELGGLETAIAIAAEEAGLDPGNVRIRSYPAPQSFWQRFGAQSRMAMIKLGLISDIVDQRSRLESTVSDFSQILSIHGSVQARMPFIFDAR